MSEGGARPETVVRPFFVFLKPGGGGECQWG